MVKYALSLEDFCKVINAVVEHEREVDLDKSESFLEATNFTPVDIFESIGVSYDTIYTHSPRS